MIKYTQIMRNYLKKKNKLLKNKKTNMKIC